MKQILLVWLLFYTTCVFPQKYHFDNLSRADGLSQASGTTFIQDPLGYMWIGTYDGLNRFDGNTFEKFYRDHDNSSTIPNNSITDLVYDSSGYLLISTNNGFSRYDLSQGKFENSSANNELRSLRKIHYTADHELWLLTDDQTIKMADFNSISNVIELSSRDIIKINTQRYWFGTDEGLISYDLKNGISEILLSNHKIYELREIDDTIWVATNKGLYLANKTTGNIETIEVLTNQDCKAIEVDNEGNIWVATDYVSILNTTDLTLRQASSDKISMDRNANILCLYKDRDGGMWLGTDGFGINYYNPIKVSLTHINYLPHESNSLPSPFVTSVYEDNIGQIWIGTIKGLSSYEPHTHKHDNYDKNDGLPSRHILAINYWHEKLIVGTKNGLAYKDGKGFKVIYPTLKNLEINTLLPDNNQLWLGTSEGLYFIDDSVSDPIKIAEIYEEISALHIDNAGNLWCGTSHGLLKIKDKRIVKKYVHESNNDRSLYNDYVKSIEVDQDGRLWIGTKEGLSLYHPESDNFSTIVREDGLPNDLIYGILSTKNDKLWISTNNGFCQYDPDSKSFRKFTSEDNLQSNEFNTGAYHLGESGFVYLGGINGLNIFKPDKIRPTFGSPLTNITSIELHNIPLEIDTKGILTQHASMVDTIRLIHNQNNLTFRFTSINYIEPKNPQYRYRLINFDTTWVYSDLPVAQFTNLKPGDYHFLASSAGRDNKWSDVDHPVTIIIKPPLWEILWFQTLIIISTLLIIYWLYKWRVRSFKIQRRNLEKLVQERTEEIAAQNEELQAQSDAIMESNDLLSEQKEELHSLNNDLEHKVKERTLKLSTVNEHLNEVNRELDLFIYRSSHDLRGPVASLLGLSTILAMEKKDEATLAITNKISQTAKKLNTTLNKLLTINVINRVARPDVAINLNALLSDLGEQHRTKNVVLNNLNIDVLEDIEICVDQELLIIILDQLYDNACTFITGNQVDITIRYEDLDLVEQHKIIFSDTGDGISTETGENIFDMFYRGSDKSQGNGLGLYVVKKAIAKLGGKVEYSSEENSGTSFFLYIPK